MAMKQVIGLGGLVSALCIVTIAHGQTPSAAEEGWAKMTRCASLGDDKARHTCTDSALREAGLLTEETKAAAKRKAFGLQKPSEPLAAAAAPVAAPASALPASAASPTPAPAPAPEPAKKKDAREHLE